MQNNDETIFQYSGLRKLTRWKVKVNVVISKKSRWERCVCFWASRGSAQDGKSLARLCQGWWAPCHLFSGMIFWAYAPYLPNHIQLQVPKFPVSKTTPSEVWGTFLTARLVSGLAWNIANGSGNTMAQHTECFGFAIVFRQCCAAFKQ